jgi:hypothetical protein
MYFCMKKDNGKQTRFAQHIQFASSPCVDNQISLSSTAGRDTAALSRDYSIDP